MTPLNSKVDKLKINDFIKKNWKKLSRRELSIKCGITEEAVRKREKSLNIKRVFQTSLKDDIEDFQERKEETETKTKLKFALKQIKELENEKEDLFKLKKDPEIFKIKDVDGSPAEAVAFMVASDWHIEEEVKPETVNGLNSYNLEVSKKRAENFFSNGAWLIKMAQKHSKINQLVLPLLGDFITNSLRDENLENNLLQPGDALWRAKSYIASGIRYLLDNTDVEITIPCHTGNHGRMTDKVHIATEGGNSLEKYMYRNLAEYFENEPRVKFLISDGGISYLKVYNKTVRFLHGHSFKGGGGVGGIVVPIRRGVGQLNKSKWADLTIMGHFHQTKFEQDFFVNGSLIGWNTFAEFIKADFEEPKQTFFIMHSHAGGTPSLMSPIWLDKKK